MSIKSLLQIILFLLIIIILGGIYFIYFYTGSLNKQEIVLNELKLDRSKNLTNQSTNQDILEEIDTTQKNNLLFKNKEKSDQKSVLEENVTKIDKDKIKKIKMMKKR